MLQGNGTGGWGELVRLSTPFHRVLSWPLKGQPREGRIGICYPFEHFWLGRKKRRATGEGSLVKRWKGTPVRHCLSGWTGADLLRPHSSPTMKTCARLQGTLVSFFLLLNFLFLLLSSLEIDATLTLFRFFEIFIQQFSRDLMIFESLRFFFRYMWKLIYLSEFLNFKYQCDVRVFGEIYGDLRYIYWFNFWIQRRLFLQNFYFLFFF